MNLELDREKNGNRKRMHPFNIHIKNEYEYKYPYRWFCQIRIQIIWISRHMNPSLDTRHELLLVATHHDEAIGCHN
jgi:hypothetical protein